MAARRTAGDLSANAICISSSGLPPLLRRSASSAARRTGCEASFFNIASSAGAAPAAPLLAGRLGQRDLHLFGGVGRHRRQHPLDGGPRRGAVARRRRRRLRGERRQVEAVDAIERRGRGPHAEDRHRLDAERLGPLDVGGERGHAIDRVARADAQVGVQGAAQIRLAGERRVGQRRGQRRHGADDRAVVVDGAGRVGRDRRVGVLEEARHAGVLHAAEGDDGGRAHRRLRVRGQRLERLGVADRGERDGADVLDVHVVAVVVGQHVDDGGAARLVDGAGDRLGGEVAGARRGVHQQRQHLRRQRRDLHVADHPRRLGPDLAVLIGQELGEDRRPSRRPCGPAAPGPTARAAGPGRRSCCGRRRAARRSRRGARGRTAPSAGRACPRATAAARSPAWRPSRSRRRAA